MSIASTMVVPGLRIVGYASTASPTADAMNYLHSLFVHYISYADNVYTDFFFKKKNLLGLGFYLHSRNYYFVDFLLFLF